MKLQILLLHLVAVLALSAAPGDLDPSFDNGTGFDATISTMASQSDGKLIIGGGFKEVNGAAHTNIVRLNADGTIDGSFLASAYANNTIAAIAVQPLDGKVLIGGSFTIVNGVTRNRIARLNADGSLDGSFNPGSGFNNTVHSIDVQPNSRILVGGDFTTYKGSGQPRLTRLLSDASLDATFNPGTGPNNSVWALELQDDGRVLLGGTFTSFNGQPRSRVAMLLGTGALDNSFDPGEGPNTHVRAVLAQPDGNILIGGDFTLVNGTSRNRIARLSATGILDDTFNIGSGANNYVESLGLQDDGKILVGGRFTTFRGAAHGRILRLLSDGTTDPAFNAGSGANDIVYAIQIDPEGAAIIGGNFTTVDGFRRDHIARLQGDVGGPLTPLVFLSVTLVGNNAELMVQGTVGQGYVIEWSTDFGMWETAASGLISESPFSVLVPVAGLEQQFFRGVTAP